MAETQQKAKYAKLQVRSYNQSNSEEKIKNHALHKSISPFNAGKQKNKTYHPNPWKR